MLKNYLKIAWRNIIRHKVYATVNIAGLALGICACMVIYVIVSYELGFDTFHPDKNRIYRVMGDVTESTGDKLHFARVPAPVSQSGRSALSGVETIAAIIPYNARITVPDGDNPPKYFESRATGSRLSGTVIAEPQYFTIFRYEWLAGNPGLSLQKPFSVVLTESKARQYFGLVPPDKIIGRSLIYEDSLTVSVAGVIKDWDKNTDLTFTDFISFGTLRNSFLKNRINPDSWRQNAMSAWVFTKLEKAVKPVRVTDQMEALVQINGDPETKPALWLEPLSNLHFNADIIENPIRTAHKPTLYILMGIALFILLLAIINFVNLSTALSIMRAKEVGIRKVLGSGRASLVFQFLAETLLLTLFAVLIAVLLVSPVLNKFGSFIPNGVSFNLFQPSAIIFLLAITILTAIASGLYPAVVLSSYQPARNLKGTGNQAGNEKWLLRKGLIVFQFSVSLVFIIGSIVIASQLSYTRKKDPGFVADAIVTVETPRGDSFSKINVLTQKFKQLPGIAKVALQWIAPMTDNPRGMKLKFKATDDKDFWVTQVAGNEDFIPLYQIKLLAGRNLARTDSVNEFVINESLSRLMGDKVPAESLGKVLYWNDKPYPVVGVAADFHTNSFHELITPLCIINRPERQGAIAVKIASKGDQAGTIRTALSQLEKTWKQVYPSASFNYRFYDESLALLYEKDQQTATLINVSTAVTIFISCIGLFGLTLFTAQKRAREISIRKILGAGISNILILLSKDFVILVVIALFIASPVAWYFMNQWLQGFAYHIHISGWVFAFAGIAAVLFALVTVSFQSLKAAIANPIKNLRAE